MSIVTLGIDAEELELDILPQIERSFNVKFYPAELANTCTFGELCEAVLAKLPVENAADCTSQQAFYKLRRAFATHVATQQILPSSKLEQLLPTGCQRRRAVAAVESELGIKLRLLGMSTAIAYSGAALLAGSVICLFFDHFRQLGMEGIALTTIGLDIASRIGTSLRFDTMRDLTEDVVDHHYRAIRRHPATVNRAEVVPQLCRIISQSCGLSPDELTAEAIL